MCEMCELVKTGVLDDCDPPDVIQSWCGQERVIPEDAVMHYIETIETRMAEKREGFQFSRMDVAALSIALTSYSIKQAFRDMAEELIMKGMILSDPRATPEKAATYMVCAEMVAEGVPTRFGDIVDELKYAIGYVEPEEEEELVAESASEVFVELMSSVGAEMAADD